MAEIQGGILAGRGRGRYVGLVFFRFAEPAKVTAHRAALAAAAGSVTTALQQYRRVGRGRADALRSLMLTRDGLAAIGIDPDSVQPNLPRMSEPGECLLLGDKLAQNGKPETWQRAYRDRIDGVWLLGHDRAAKLAREISLRRQWCLDNGAFPVKVERGRVPADGREPFGFRDGISMQKFFRRDPEALPTSLDEVFFRHADEWCSFMVFRKLEQNVAAFRAWERSQPEGAAAALVGRRRDGRHLLGTPSGQKPTLNGFDFSTDPAGKACPFHAHIRRTNPRAMVQSADFSRRHHLVRRGVVYGTKSDLAREGGAAAGVGLLFLAYSGDLAGFKEIQGTWMASRDFPVPESQQTEKKDMLMFGPPETAVPQGIPHVPWIVPKGGAYFIVPSRPWLGKLSAQAGTA